mmetsp:Transcript_40096/g.71971  ORF Transcript_40096/g.71971 Transcript_40096/m.71971 type:complete len:120 (-) Transcript_40096:188-547(-)
MSRTVQLFCLLLVAVLALFSANVGASRVGSAMSATTGGRGLLVIPRGGVELKKYQQRQKEEEGAEGDFEGGNDQEGGEYEGKEEDGDVDGGDFDQNDEDAEPEEDNDNFEEEEEDEDRF